jgi:hypothetical protein
MRVVTHELATPIDPERTQSLGGNAGERVESSDLPRPRRLSRMSVSPPLILFQALKRLRPPNLMDIPNSVNDE